MADPLVLRVGPVSQADGTTPQARAGKEGQFIVGQVHGKYTEAVSRGNCYAAQTAASGVAPGTAIGTTGAFTLSNPKGSGKRLVVQKLGMAYLSGTLGAGVVHILTNNDPTAAAPTGTAITPTNLDLGAANNSVAKPLTTSTLPVAPTQIGLLASVNAAAGATDAMPSTPVEKDVDGEIVIEPGCSLTLSATAAAGTAPKVIFNATWEEVPLI
jgi:hypothetical protein